MSADNAMVQRFLTALRESEDVFDSPGSYGYVTDLDDYIQPGSQIDGWWTAEQLRYALDAAITGEAAGGRTD
ncbi:hypothetical protein SEA_FREGLEY_10 [Microbacterium phage Fregley]|nr:hypothetical protein SEA_FREGLEY_10 [Microbacterium phage Fregley]WNT44221.1 hypothetical protein SEA_CANDC_8 [Microbacterium phage CandC]